jgi:small subunit ribosomal protein S16
MVTIRLSRGGSKKKPFYQMLVTDSRKPRDGRYIERVGYYNPRARGGEIPLSVNKERIDYWVGQGAQPSGKVISLLKLHQQESKA